MEYRGSHLKFQVKSPGEMGERVSAFLRGLHARKTADQVSAETGISAKTISTWLDGTSCPGGVAFARLVMAYGPDFLSAVLTNPPAWLDKAARDERTAKLEREIEDRRRQIEALLR